MSGNKTYKFANRFGKVSFIDSISKDNTDKLSTTGKEQFSFNGYGIMSSEIIKPESIFKNVNGSFNQNSVFVEIIPMLGISRNTQERSEIFVRICINTSSRYAMMFSSKDVTFPLSRLSVFDLFLKLLLKTSNISSVSLLVFPYKGQIGSPVAGSRESGTCSPA